MENFLGVDIGGTNVKVGVVNPKGEILYHKKFPTADLRQDSNFLGNFIDLIGKLLTKKQDVKKVGIGVPGILDKTRATPIEVPAISDLNGRPLKAALEKQFPNIQFQVENDVNAAALGEYYFSKENVPEDYIFVTLGTGVGGAAIINKQIFFGGDGNSMELGHVISSNGKKLEKNIGKKGILKMATGLWDEYQGNSLFDTPEDISIKGLVKAASKGDRLALEVFDKVGEQLAFGLVAAIRILDIKNIYIGGGVSSACEYIKGGMYKIFDNYLSPYYRNPLSLRRATLQNEAGIIGAAALCFIPAAKKVEID